MKKGSLADEIENCCVGQKLLKTLVQPAHSTPDCTGGRPVAVLTGHEAGDNGIGADNDLGKFAELQPTQVANNLVSPVLSLHGTYDLCMFHALECLGDDVKGNIQPVAQHSCCKKLAW